jgi:hypothetical protein
VWNANVIIRELRERGYTGGYTILTDWLRPQRKSAQVAGFRKMPCAFDNNSRRPVTSSRNGRKLEHRTVKSTES